jgi:hypothetical protein
MLYAVAAFFALPCEEEGRGRSHACVICFDCHSSAGAAPGLHPLPVPQRLQVSRASALMAKLAEHEEMHPASSQHHYIYTA